MENGTVNLHIADHIGSIEFFHPQSNSLPGALLNKLAETITEAGNNDDIKVIVLRSAGNKAFCAGASFDELIAIKEFAAGQQFFSGFAKVINETTVFSSSIHCLNLIEIIDGKQHHIRNLANTLCTAPSLFPSTYGRVLASSMALK